MPDRFKTYNDSFCVLLVDDSKTQLLQLQNIFTQQHYQVFTADSAEAALNILETEWPSLVISDIMMPGMNGFDLCREIKNNKKGENLPVILLTSLSGPEDVLEGLACGADDFVTKPFDPEYLISHAYQTIINSRLADTEKVRITLELDVLGKRRVISAYQHQVLSLMLSTYEAAVMHNRDLLQAQEELKVINDHLEEMVEERTREVKENEAKYTDLYNTAPIMLMSVDLQTESITTCNDTFLNLTGFSREEILGKSVVRLYHSNYPEEIRDELNTLKLKGENKETEKNLLTKQGKKIPVLVSMQPHLDISGKIREARIVLQDLRSLKIAEERLKQSEERYRAVSDTAVDAIVTMDSKGRIVSWNGSTEKMFGFSSKEIEEKTIELLLPDQDFIDQNNPVREINSMDDVIRLGRITEIQARHHNGNTFPAEISLAGWETAHESFFTAIIRDITERKKWESELQKAKIKAEESDTLKTAFLANMSHEIRTPMNGILGFAQLLKDPELTTENRDKYINIINRSSEQLLKIITNIVDISKIEAGFKDLNLTEIHLQTLLDHVIFLFKPMAKEKNIRLLLENNIPEDRSILLSDEIKLKQMLSHLLDNAMKFTSQGEIRLYVEADERNIRFLVSDTGEGIEPHLLEVIFDRFRQGSLAIVRHTGGTGLGLSLARSYAGMLNGTLTVTSKPGEGSTFSLELPLLKAMSASISKSGKDQPAGSKTTNSINWDSHTILMAEDEEGNALYLKMALKKTGINILHAENGEEAVNMCKNHPEISLVLIDVKMPVLDGLSATRQIRTFKPELPIIATTAFTMSSDRDRCINAGCTDYLPKPIEQNKLIHMLSTYLS